MLKPLFLALISCIGFSGCAAFTTSQTWKTVMNTRPDSYSDEADTSDAYAAKLHGILKSASVEHKVVKYEYHYTTNLREEAVGTHTAVIYRDNIDSNNPWWLMEDRINRPVWVAGATPADQVSFYIHHDQSQYFIQHHVDVVSEKDFSGGDDHKSSLAMARSATGYRTAGASSPGRFHSSESNANYFEISAGLPRSGTHKGSASASATGSASSASGAASDSAIALFHSVHGTAYNPSSALDRRKMTSLQNDITRHRHPLASQTF